ncbi:MAG: GNAT family N-acetyltransferase [Anaerolineae bacterium]
MNIFRPTVDQVLVFLPDLVALLQETVASGASVGFLFPLSDLDAETYWRQVLADLAGSHHVLLVARVDEQVAGAVQLVMATRPNATHRAEVAKLMVYTRFRRRGIGRALMQAIEEEARKAGRTTLVLDTRQGDPSEKLYLALGYARAGVIPEYAQSANGALDPTVLMYKLLREGPVSNLSHTRPTG